MNDEKMVNDITLQKTVFFHPSLTKKMVKNLNGMETIFVLRVLLCALRP